MSGVNKVILIGNLGAEPEIRTTPNGATCANIRLAVSETWKDQSGQRQEKTEWVNVVAWKALADIIGKYLHKGSKVYIEGKLSTRSWDDKATGQKRYSTEVIADTLNMLDSRNDSDAPAPQAQRPAARPATSGFGRTPSPADDPGLPF